MSEKNIKRTTKLFVLTEYEAEEQYLSEMHKNGWKLTEGKHFTFEKCEPEDVVYRLDFPGEIKDKDPYIKMFEDYGWEYIYEFNGFYYFRKNADGISPEDLEIFNDDGSKLEMMKKIIDKGLKPSIILFFLLVFPNFFNVVVTLNTRYLPISIALITGYGILFALYIYIFVRSYVNYSKLKKKYSKD